MYWKTNHLKQPHYDNKNRKINKNNLTNTNNSNITINNDQPPSCNGNDIIRFAFAQSIEPFIPDTVGTTTSLELGPFPTLSGQNIKLESILTLKFDPLLPEEYIILLITLVLYDKILVRETVLPDGSIDREPIPISTIHVGINDVQLAFNWVDTPQTGATTYKLSFILGNIPDSSISALYRFIYATIFPQSIVIG